VVAIEKPWPPHQGSLVVGTEPGDSTCMLVKVHWAALVGPPGPSKCSTLGTLAAPPPDGAAIQLVS
jgi:hypothetical protein